MNLVGALQKHMYWKIEFRDAISNQGEMDAVTIAKDNCCELGKWLYGEGKIECSGFPGYAITLREQYRLAWRSIQGDFTHFRRNPYA